MAASAVIARNGIRFRSGRRIISTNTNKLFNARSQKHKLLQSNSRSFCRLNAFDSKQAHRALVTKHKK